MQELQSINPDLVLLCYSMDNMESFLEVKEFVFLQRDAFNIEAERQPIQVLVGITLNSLESEHRMVSAADGQNFCKIHGIDYFTEVNAC